MKLNEDPDGRIAHLIKLCEEYPYDTCTIDDTDQSVRYRNKHTGKWVIDDRTSIIFHDPKSINHMTLSYNQAVYNDLMVIGITSGLEHSKYFDSQKASNLKHGIEKGYAFFGWCVNVEYLKSVIELCGL